MARSTANTSKVASAKRKTKEHKEESKKINFDDDYLALSDGSDKDKYKGETKDPPDEDGDPKFDTSGFESKNIEETKPKKKRRKTKEKKTRAAAGDGNDDASSSEVMSVTPHDEYLAKKRRNADDLEADKRNRAANMKADAARSGAISKSAEPSLRLFMRLGVEKCPPAA